MLAFSPALLAFALALVAAPVAEAASTTCAAGTYFNKTHQACYPCGANALTCSSTTIALTCAKGYTVQSGLCLVLVVTKTATVTGGFAPTVMTTVTSTLVKPLTTVTKASTWTMTRMASTSTISSTTTVTSIKSATTTKIETKIESSTSTPISTSTVAKAVATVLSTVRNAKLGYAGCFSMWDINISVNGNQRVIHLSSYTASTAVAACHAGLQSFVAESPPEAGSTFTCMVFNDSDGSFLLNQAAAPFDPTKRVDDSYCSSACVNDPDATSDIVASYGKELCGGLVPNVQNYASVYALRTDL